MEKIPIDNDAIKHDLLERVVKTAKSKMIPPEFIQKFDINTIFIDSVTDENKTKIRGFVECVLCQNSSNKENRITISTKETADKQYWVMSNFGKHLEIHISDTKKNEKEKQVLEY